MLPVTHFFNYYLELNESNALQPKEFIFGKNFSSNLANIWNKAVDGTLGNLVAYLSSRRW